MKGSIKLKGKGLVKNPRRFQIKENYPEEETKQERPEICYQRTQVEKVLQEVSNYNESCGQLMQDVVKRCLTERSEMEVMGAHTKSDPGVDKTSSDLSSENKKINQNGK